MAIISNKYFGSRSYSAVKRMRCVFRFCVNVVMFDVWMLQKLFPGNVRQQAENVKLWAWTQV